MVGGAELVQELEEHLDGRSAKSLRFALDLRWPAEGGTAAQALPQPLGEGALSAGVPKSKGSAMSWMPKATR